MTSTPTRVHIVIFLAGVLFVGSLTGVFTASQQTATAPEAAGAQGQLATMQQYCVSCHNDRAKVADVSFQGITPESIAQRAEVFEKAVRKMRGRVMPPPNARQPGAAAVDSLVSYLEDSLDRAETQAHVRDQVVLHRLNRREYTNAVRDLLAVDFDATEVLPADDIAEGYDNIASALQVSPSFIEQYVIAARAVAVKALGRPDARPGGWTFRAGPGTQLTHVPGLPLGTRGGILARVDLPSDGEYQVDIADIVTHIWGNGMAVIPSVDSVTALDVAKMLLDAGANPNLQLKRRPPYRDVPQDRGGDTILAQGATPLLRAARAGDAPLVDLLLKHKALVDLPSKEGVTPLMAAAGVEFGTRVTRGRNRTNEGVLATMRLLIDAGANVNARNVTDSPRTGEYSAAATAAARAGRGGRASQVPSASAVPHQTALHGAAERGYTAFVKFLAENGADLQAKDANGRTALDLAKGIGVPGIKQAASEGFPETAALIESLMANK